ncbi:beta-carotene hydroxylase [Sulfodiicoccus acidiphilus]|uniref:Beta-carotene hydroxylase n=1 Tax=Sulfodiicoccus acidiphilus TaxID=1670455 RepID=A0A348B644_9CREN|nr:sterol desaturase family protein [Sulfodiicoccus acidiphilus]BBD73646.1 beta-carotene hydroxylase [Sulfodiicoccus acidiphilus]GGU02079.1 beta-carotene hydroxylase [Sulfodiicoccus acidiphilus]
MDVELLVVGLTTFVGMEFVARGTHKYVMHGVLWSLHKDHHYPSNSTFQRNDLFGLMFAGIATTLVWYWFRTGDYYLLAVALGMAAYGASYLTVHDMIIHDRHARLRRRGINNRYLRRLIQVHDLHHEEGEGNWGFLLIIPGLDHFPERKVRA